MITKLVLSLACFGPGGFLLRRVWRDVQVVKASKSWRSVSGRVISTSCLEQVYKGDDSDTTSYLPVVQYEYQVGNQTYRGNRVAFTEEGRGSMKKAFQVLGAFPAGHPVTVYYDPTKPADAVLQRRGPGNMLGAVLGCALMLAGLAILFTDERFFNE